MNIEQANIKELVITGTKNDKVSQRYILIDSEEGRDLIKSEHIDINPEMEEF